MAKSLTLSGKEFASNSSNWRNIIHQPYLYCKAHLVTSNLFDFVGGLHVPLEQFVVLSDSRAKFSSVLSNEMVQRHVLVQILSIEGVAATAELLLRVAVARNRIYLPLQHFAVNAQNLGTLVAEVLEHEICNDAIQQKFVLIGYHFQFC